MTRVKEKLGIYGQNRAEACKICPNKMLMYWELFMGFFFTGNINNVADDATRQINGNWNYS